MVSTNFNQNSEKTSDFSSVEWLIEQAVKKQKEGQTDEAIAYYLEIIELDVNQPTWLYSNDNTLMDLVNSLDKCMKLGEMALKVYPDSEEIQQAAKIIQEKHNNLMCEVESASNRDKIDNLQSQATIKHKEGKFEEAIALYQKCIEFKESQPDWVYANLITLLSLLGFTDKAIELINEALIIHPQSDELYRSAGITFKRKFDHDNSIKYYLKSIEINQKQPSWLYSYLVENLLSTSKIEKAIEIGNLGIKIHHESAWIRYHLADAFMLVGNWEEAWLNFNQASENMSNLPKIKDKLKSAFNNLEKDKKFDVISKYHVNYNNVLDSDKLDSALNTIENRLDNPIEENTEQKNLSESTYPQTFNLVDNGSIDLQKGDNFTRKLSYGEIDEHHLDQIYSLFDEKFYLRQLGEIKDKSSNLVEHYLKFGWKQNASPNRLFDTQYYLSQAKGLKSLEINPFIHYIVEGWKVFLNPHPLFYANFYHEQIGNNDVNPLYHYFVSKGFAKFSPHPAFDLEYYCSQVPKLDPNKESAILHFLYCPEFPTRVSPNPVFDPQWYIQNNIDIKQNKLCPNFHYLKYGFKEAHRPVNKIFSQEYLYNLFPNYSFREFNPWQFYQAQKVYRRKRIILVGHEASRTGAPLILLRIAQDISQMQDVEIFTILCRGGSILEEYKRFSHVYVTEDKWGKDFEEIENFISYLGDNLPVFAIVNCAESRQVSKSLNRLGIPVCFLVHEMADHYSASDWSQIYLSSQKVIFPSQFVAERARKKIPEQKNKIQVLGQGLLRDNFGKYGRESSRRQIIEELGFPEDTCIIMGCGTMDYRKGIDLFVGTARETICKLEHSEVIQNVRFIWVGQKIDTHDNYNPSYWALKEIKNAGLEKLIVHVPPTNDVEKYFLASDIFLLTSRSDPFPCVVHEAMVCSLPVIYFSNSGGVSELVKDKAGIEVPYGSTIEMADAVLSLILDPHKRKNFGQYGEEIIRRDYKFRDYTEKIVSSMCKKVKSDCNFAYIQNDKQKNKKTIYFLSPDWGLSGVNTFTVNLIKGLNKLGFDSKILFILDKDPCFPTDKSLMPDVPYIFLHSDKSKPYPKNIWLRMLQFFNHHDPCILVPNYHYVGSSISPILPDHIGIVGIGHSDHQEHYEHVYRLGRYWNRIVAVSDLILNQIIEHNESFKSKSLTIRYGVPCPAHLEKKSLIFKNKTIERPIRLVYSGRLITFQKRIERYVELTNLLINEGIDFHLTILGDGEKYNYMREELYPLIEQGIVELPGRVDFETVGQVLKQSDVFLLLSDFEGLPLSLIEAMTFGCIPMVSDMRSGIPEIIQNGENGFICQKNNLYSFVEKIRMLSNNADIIKSVSQKAFDSVEQYKLRDFDMTKEYANMFDKVLEEISQEKYTRPESLAFKSAFPGVLAPSWIYSK